MTRTTCNSTEQGDELIVETIHSAWLGFFVWALLHFPKDDEPRVPDSTTQLPS